MKQLSNTLCLICLLFIIDITNSQSINLIKNNYQREPIFIPDSSRIPCNLFNSSDSCITECECEWCSADFKCYDIGDKINCSVLLKRNENCLASGIVIITITLIIPLSVCVFVCCIKIIGYLRDRLRGYIYKYTILQNDYEMQDNHSNI